MQYRFCRAWLGSKDAVDRLGQLDRHPVNVMRIPMKAKPGPRRRAHV